VLSPQNAFFPTPALRRRLLPLLLLLPKPLVVLHPPLPRHSWMLLRVRADWTACSPRHSMGNSPLDHLEASALWVQLQARAATRDERTTQRRRHSIQCQASSTAQWAPGVAFYRHFIQNGTPREGARPPPPSKETCSFLNPILVNSILRPMNTI
jgi:hypothetical protein